MEQFKGFVSDIIFHNEENGYAVFEIETQGETLTCTGTAVGITVGSGCEVTGEYTEHPLYGLQLKITQYRACAPEDSEAMYRYLSSGAVKGVGKALAGRIVQRFGDDTLRIMEEEPERLSEIKGISDRMAREIAFVMEEKRDVRQAMIYLQQYGISNTKALKIWQTYGMEIYSILKENPYRLAEDIDGIGFAAADELAVKIGIEADSEFRIRSGLLYILGMTLGEGSTFLPAEELIRQTAALLDLPEDAILLQLENLAIERKIICKNKDGIRQVYLSSAFLEERTIARLLLELKDSPVTGQDAEGAGEVIRRLEEEEGICLDDLQRQACVLSATKPLVLITGGPGTGKTTAMRIMIHYFETQRQIVLLCAPTGRAAKRMTEATGHEALTIHRLLGVKVTAGEGNEGFSGFDRDESNPLEADAVIVDEMSMTDMHLFGALLKALEPGTRLILVGDRDQLPCVGPGSVLKDMIGSEVFPVVMLEKIFRQAMESEIVMNAHRLLQGEPMKLENRNRDFFFLERSEALPIYKHTVQLIREKLPPYVHCDPQEIQVLTPMKKGSLGVEKLNEALQAVLNPADPGKKEMTRHGVIFREGDKVMQVRNNYQIQWEVRGNFGLAIERGSGIFNGDCGKIVRIMEGLRQVEVCFDDNKTVDFSYENMDEMELAYAITVHKAQGSEYPAVILPLLSGPPALMNRNLLYTAITRAKNCVVILGSRAAVQRMAENTDSGNRYTGLGDRIHEILEIQESGDTW